MHLIRLGRRRIAFLGGSDAESNQRRAGYLRALGENGIDPDPALVARVEFELENAEAAIDGFLRRGVSFDAVVAASDLIALGAIRALRRAGLSVPADVSVVGYDDMLLGRLSTPDAQHDSAGHAESRTPARLQDPGPRARQSSGNASDGPDRAGIPAAPEASVARALRRAGAHAAQNPSTSDVLYAGRGSGPVGARRTSMRLTLRACRAQSPYAGETSPNMLASG